MKIIHKKNIRKVTKSFAIAIAFLSLVLVSSALLLTVTEGTTNGKFNNFFDAFWFSLVTIATVGYGDLYPRTFMGKLITILLIVVGVTVFTAITAKISAFLVEEEVEEDILTEDKKLNTILSEEDRTAALEKRILRAEATLEKDIDHIERQLQKKM